MPFDLIRTTFLFLAPVAILPSLHADFLWTDSPGKYLELSNDGKPVARYVYEPLDASTPERRDETSKPYCQVYFFQWNHYGELLTKGPEGDFPQQRGIFYGFNRISYQDAAGKQHNYVDTWHCRNAAEVHRRFTDQQAGKNDASFTSEIDWIGDDDLPFATESRTMRFSFVGTDTLIDFDSVLTPRFDELLLDGDPHMAGFQFRAHRDVGEKYANATYFIRPVTGIGRPGTAINWSPKNDTAQTRDLPWKAMCITLRNTQITISYLDHPENPKPARASERSYGRFGTCFTTTVKKSSPLRVRYRLVIHPGEYETGDEIAALSKAWLAKSPAKDQSQKP